eukprot:scaffold4545_cov139-Amphora_coffeaeformis.AAC.7
MEGEKMDGMDAIQNVAAGAAVSVTEETQKTMEGAAESAAALPMTTTGPRRKKQDLSREQLMAIVNMRLSMPDVQDYVFTSEDGDDYDGEIDDNVDENFPFRCPNLKDYTIENGSPLIYLKNPHGCLFKNKVVFCCPEDDGIVLDCLADHLLVVPNRSWAETTRFLSKFTKLNCRSFMDRNETAIRGILAKAKGIQASRQLDDGTTPSACTDSLFMKQWRHADTNFRQIQGGHLQTHGGINQLLGGQVQVLELLKGFQAEQRAQRESNDKNLQALRESNDKN